MPDFYRELAEYVNRNEELVKCRCDYASLELSFQFHNYKDRILEYYRETDLYIYALSSYQTLLAKYNFHEWLKSAFNFYGWKSTLDMGGGIGEYSIIAYKEGADTFYQDVSGSKTVDYALWRFGRYNVHPTLLDENYKIDREYDVIVAMDVLEHLENPAEVIKDIVESTHLIFRLILKK
jgi:2-polyprenyl-3-methyl-5-hydroxy-6-metoxy-1,4-benzoquinol methylase